MKWIIDVKLDDCGLAGSLVCIQNKYCIQVNWPYRPQIFGRSSLFGSSAEWRERGITALRIVITVSEDLNGIDEFWPRSIHIS